MTTTRKGSSGRRGLRVGLAGLLLVLEAATVLAPTPLAHAQSVMRDYPVPGGSYRPGRGWLPRSVAAVVSCSACPGGAGDACWSRSSIGSGRSGWPCRPRRTGDSCSPRSPRRACGARLRGELSALNVEVMDGPAGATWRIKEQA